MEPVTKAATKTRSKKRRKLDIDGRLRSDQSLPRTKTHPLRKGHLTNAEHLGLIEHALGRLVARLEESDEEAGKEE